MSEFTKGEVVYDQVVNNAIDIVSKNTGKAVAQVINENDELDELDELDIANAERLVKCWNNHDKLLAACEMGLMAVEGLIKIKKMTGTETSEGSKGKEFIEAAIAEAKP